MKKAIINIMMTAFSLLLFLGCNSTNESNSDDKLNEWAIKVNAIDSEGKLGDTNTRFGQVYPATDDVDRYDLVSASRPFSGDFMEVVYLIDGSENEFSTNYHSVAEGQNDEWIFVVKTNNPDRTITVSWPGIFKIDSAEDEFKRVRLYNEFKTYDPIMEKMQLVDMKTGRVISAVMDGKVQNYTFNMDGETERTFKWELLSDKTNNHVEDASDKESAIELGKQNSVKLNKKMNFDMFPPEFDIKEDN